MRIELKHFFLLSLLTSCGGSSGGGGDNPAPSPPPAANEQPQVFSQIPEGEKEVFTFNSKAALGTSNIYCATSGYGYAIDENLRKMSVCCIALNQVASLDGSSKFITRKADRIFIKGEKCEAVVLSGNVGALALPVDVDVSSQRYVNIGGDRPANMFGSVTGQVTVTGSSTFDTNLVGAMPLNLSGKSKLSNIHSLGTPIIYTLQDTSGFNDLSMMNVKIEGHGNLAGGLQLSTGETSTRSTSGMTMKFENVKVTAEKANPVALIGYPFDIAGVEILAGKKYQPHVGLLGGYGETTGVIKETRYPVSVNLQLFAGSKLTVTPGVKLKVPSNAPGHAPFRGSKYALVMEGADDNHIVVTSLQDDSVGGDTNGDGNATKGDLFSLLIHENGRWRSDASNVVMHNVDLIGAGIDVEKEESKIVLGKVTLRPAQDGTSWKNLISLEHNGTNAQLFMDGSVEAWHPIETYLETGNLKLSTVIYNGYASQIHGVNQLTVHNTSATATKVDQDVRVLASLGNEGCKSSYDSSGQLTAETKSWTYYISGGALKQCQ